MKRWMHVLGSLVALAVFCVALWLLWHELKHYRPEDIRRQLAAIPAWKLGAAVLLTIVNYVVLFGYDVLAMRAVGCHLPWGRLSLVSFTGFALSANLGALLGGTSARVRLYTAWNLRPGEIVQLIIMLAITFWIGAFALAGLVFVVSPFPIPARLNLPIDSVRPLGIGLLILDAAFLGFTCLRRWSVKFGEVEVALPTGRIALAQTVVAASDLALAAACLYVLLPAGLHLSYFEFLGIYLLGITAAVVTHVPGGVGIFELVVLTFVAPTSADTVVASLLAFRVVYFLLPLLVAVGLLVAHEITLRWSTVRRGSRVVSQWSTVAKPWLLALAIGGAGASLMYAIITPIPANHRSLFQRTVPLSIVELSHLLTALSGAALLMLGATWQVQSKSQFRLTSVFLALGILGSLLSGLDVVPAGICLATVGLLWLVQETGTHDVRDNSATGSWSIGVLAAMTLLAAGWSAAWWYHARGYSHSMWVEVSYVADVSRCLRALGLASFSLLVGGAWLVLVRGRSRRRHDSR